MPSLGCPRMGHSAPTAPHCSKLPPKSGCLPSALSRLCPVPAWQGPCTSGMRDLGSWRGSEHCLLTGGRSMAGLLTLLCSVQAKPGLFLPPRGGGQDPDKGSPHPHGPKGNGSTSLTRAVTTHLVPACWVRGASMRLPSTPGWGG